MTNTFGTYLVTDRALFSVLNAKTTAPAEELRLEHNGLMEDVTANEVALMNYKRKLRLGGIV